MEPTIQNPQPGQHDFCGACSPSSSSEYSSQHTFSVGVFEWVPRRSKAGCRKGPVKVRVRGRVQDVELVYAKAREIVAALDRGDYQGPANVRVSS